MHDGLSPVAQQPAVSMSKCGARPQHVAQVLASHALDACTALVCGGGQEGGVLVAQGGAGPQQVAQALGQHTRTTQGDRHKADLSYREVKQIKHAALQPISKCRKAVQGADSARVRSM